MPDVLMNNLAIVAQILDMFAIISGIFLTLAGIMELKRMGEQRSMMSQQHGAIKPTAMLLCGAVLLVLPTMTGTALLAFFGNTSDLAYPGGGSGLGSLTQAIFVFVRVIGLGSFIRGIIMLSRAGGQQGQHGMIGKALIHIFAGILCLHVVQTMELLGSMLTVV